MTPAIPAVSELSLDEKVGQLFLSAGHGVFVNADSPAYEQFLRHVRDNHVGGITWFVSDVYETAWLTDRLQRASRIPLFVSADLESGMGMRFPDATFWPWAMAVGATGDPKLAEEEGRLIAREARTLGINFILAPVADVNINADNPVINARSFGEDPEAVSRFVAAFIRGVQSEGVLATAKHFPGHGDTQTDSHRSLASLGASRERLDAIELVPFRAAIAAGVAAVMTAHISVPALDPSFAPYREYAPGENPYTTDSSEVARKPTVPASLSPRANELLRRELGFQGIVITDALDMGALTDHFDPAEAAVRAIEAGADLVPKSPDTDAAIRGVKAALASGRLTEARIDESVERILTAKRAMAATPFSMEAIFRGVDPPAHRAVAQQIATRAITLVREEKGALPLRRDASVVELIVSDFPEPGFVLGDLDRELRSRLTTAPRRFILNRNSTDADARPAIQAVAEADTVIIAFTVRVRSGEGKVEVPEVARRALGEIARGSARQIAISFGTPYLLREVPSLPTYIAAYGVQPVMQIAAARAIFGEGEIAGKLPVTIPGLYPRGHGIRKPAN